jgi:hypothetical protein
MRQVAASVFVIIIVITGLDSNKMLQGSSEQPSRTEHHSDPGGYLFSFDPIRTGPAITSEEMKTGAAECLYASVDRYRCARATRVKAAESIRSNAQADYIFIAEQQVIRFEGPDIIHPYYYSW